MYENINVSYKVIKTGNQRSVKEIKTDKENQRRVGKFCKILEN